MPKPNLVQKQTAKRAVNRNNDKHNKTYKKNKSRVDDELKHKQATTNIRRDFFKSLLTQ